MSDVINAVTKNRQNEEMIRQMVQRALRKTVNYLTVKELAGGLCNAVYLVEADGRKLVLKIASDPSVVTMRHERDYVTIEATMLAKMETEIVIPAPELVFFDDTGSLCPVPYFFMTFLEGQALGTMEPMPEEAQLKRIHKELAEICARICSISAPAYGIPAMPETYTQNNADFVRTLFTLLLQDLEDRGIAVPGTTPEHVLELVEKCRPALEQADSPCYAHTDTWDGNLMVKDGALVGLVDYAAVLFADPLMTHDFHDMWNDPAPDLLDAFGLTELTSDQKIRIQVYRLWQILGIVAERGFRQYEDPNQYQWALDLFEKNTHILENMVY